MPAARFDRFPPTGLPELDPVQYAVLLMEEHEVVGFLRFEFDSKGTLCAAGTWVHGDQRGRGAAKQMWRYLLKRCRPRRVWVRTATEAGRLLVSGLVRDYPRIAWTVVS